MMKYLIENDLLSENQSGYRRGHSCSTAMLKVMEDVRPSFDKGNLTILTLLDFRKLLTLFAIKSSFESSTYFGFSNDAVKLIESYLTNRYQRVVSRDNRSSLTPVKSGVPQGSILGPVLFSLYINDLEKCCKNVAIHLYADDAQIYLSAPLGLTEDLVFRINEDLQAISLWSKNNRLNLNSSKTQAIALSHFPYNLDNVSPIMLNGSVVKYEKIVKTLGFTLNQNLTCIDHVNASVSRMYSVLRQLWKTAYFIPKDVKLKLVKMLLVPIISYHELIYGCLDKESLGKYQLLFNNAARYIYLKRKFDHISEFSTNILDCSISIFFDRRLVLFIYKVIYTRCPKYLFSKLTFAQSTRTCNLIVPYFKYSVTSRMFFVRAVQLWNSLPRKLKSETSPKRFKSAVYSFFSN